MNGGLKPTKFALAETFANQTAKTIAEQTRVGIRCGRAGGELRSPSHRLPEDSLERLAQVCLNVAHDDA